MTSYTFYRFVSLNINKMTFVLFYNGIFVFLQLLARLCQICQPFSAERQAPSANLSVIIVCLSYWKYPI